MLGSALFGLDAWLDEGNGVGGDRPPIVLSDRFVDALARQRQAQTGQAPDAATREALVRDFVREEALVREARRRGLDRGDPIVRRRLAQKMEFLLEGTVRIPEPTERQLRAHLRDHPDRFARPARIAFEHVFFSPDARSDPRADARAALGRLRGSDGGDGRAAAGGDPFLLGGEQPLRTVERHARTFGPPFADRLAELEPGAWHGPAQSALGWHLVRVTDREPGALPPLEEVRDRVRASWMRDRREEAHRQAVERLVDSYPVREEDAP